MWAGYPEVVSSEITKFREADDVRLIGSQQCVVRKRECGAALRSRRPKHAWELHAREPDTEPGQRVKRAGPCASSSEGKRAVKVHGATESSTQQRLLGIAALE